MKYTIKLVYNKNVWASSSKAHGGSETLILKPTNSSCQIKFIKSSKLKLLFQNLWIVHDK